jgi:glycosyltransferase involved in cell wall biosynthesis
MLSAADLLVVVLEPDASTFSVPSKVLTYLAAGKAILAAIPAENSAAKLIARTGAGLVVEPSDVAGLLGAARRLLAYPERLRRSGEAGRAYANEHFDIDHITSHFEAAFYRALSRKSHSTSAADVDTGQAVDSSHEAGT